MNLPDIIYNSFRKEGAKVKPERKEVTFAPSYLSKCRRAIYYDKTGETPTNPPDLPGLLKMGWGDILHDDIQQRLVKAGILESFEEARTKEYGGLTFNYFYDGILNIEGARAILEIKTVYASGYKSIENEPKSEHVLQALSYMIFEDIDNAVILYAGRDNGYLKQHTVRIHREGEVFCTVNTYRTDYLKQWSGKVTDMVVLKQMIENKELPDRDYSIVMKRSGDVVATEFQKDTKKYKSDWRCSYCNFLDKCWKEEKEKIKNYQFFIDGVFS